MHDTLADDLQPVVVRWTMGGAAASLAPELLRERLGDDPDEAELRLLVIAGQALSTMVVPEPSGVLQGVADLPALPLPTMPDRLRPFAARVLSTRETWLRDGLLRLLVARGHVVHPADWMPTAGDDVPDVYAPWQDWVRGTQAASVGKEPGWDDLGPSGRLAMVSRLRRTDPRAAIELVSRRISAETPERRLALVETFGVGLSEDDRAFLEGLSSDRAPSVRGAATRLLARLGDDVSVGEVEDVRDLVKVESRGLLSSQRTIALSSRMNHPQRERLVRAISRSDARSFAGALGIEDVDLPAMWPWGRDVALDRQLAAMLTDTGSDDVVRAIARAVSAGSPIHASTLGKGALRLDREERVNLVRRSYANERIVTLASHALELGVVESADASTEWRSIYLQILRGGDASNVAGASEMHALGLLLTKDAARGVLDALTRAAVPAGDPRLDTLRLSASL